MMSSGQCAALTILAAAFHFTMSPAAQACSKEHPAAQVMAGWLASCTHPLCGTIHATRLPDPVGATSAPPPSCGQVVYHLDAIARASASGVVILGEAHDNPAHHALRAHMLTGASIVMEQAARDRQPALDQWRAQSNASARPQDVATLKDALAWDASGWKMYPYDPLLAALSQTRLPVVAGDVPRAEIRKAAKEGPAAVPDEARALLKLDVPQDPGLDAASAKEIEDSHCGMLPAAAIPNMAYAQRLRDATLADATLGAVQQYGSAVLLTGNSHARTDRGVPWYIRARAPETKVVSIVLVEVETGKADAEDYVPRSPGGEPAADYLIFTPPAKRSDPCATFKGQPAGAR